MLPFADTPRNRLIFAFLAYALLALSALFTLEGIFRYGVWLFLAALAVKTVLAYLAQKQE